MRDGFSRLQAKPVPDQITYLSDLLFALHGTYRSEQTEDIRNEATTLLLSIPGHAKYYQDKIEEMRAAVLADSKIPLEEIAKMQDRGQKINWEAEYLSYSTASLRTLRWMPSAETVSVLGHFLNDPEGRDGKTLLGNNVVHPGDDFQKRPANAEQATESIRLLGIEHPPFRNIDGRITDEEVDAWRDWWNEVKAGKRTYRFIGSKVEYGPDGPASMEVVQKAERDQKRDVEREAGHKKSVIATDSASTPIPGAVNDSLTFSGIIAACAAVAGALWYYLKRRTAA